MNPADPAGFIRVASSSPQLLNLPVDPVAPARRMEEIPHVLACVSMAVGRVLYRITLIS